MDGWIGSIPDPIESHQQQDPALTFSAGMADVEPTRPHQADQGRTEGSTHLQVRTSETWPPRPSAVCCTLFLSALFLAAASSTVLVMLLDASLESFFFPLFHEEFCAGTRGRRRRRENNEELVTPGEWRCFSINLENRSSVQRLCAVDGGKNSFMSQ